jgi:hypothetical protein
MNRGWSLDRMNRTTILGILGFVLVTGCSTEPETGSTAAEGGSTVSTGQGGSASSTDAGGSPEAQPDEAAATMVSDAAPAGADDFFAQYGAALCKRLFECPLPNDDDLGARNVLGSLARCNQIAPELFRRGSNYAELFAAVAAGTLRYDASRAAACFAALRLCGAPMNPDQVPDCREMFEGTVQPNGPCYVDQDCAGDAYCATPSDAGFQRICPGSCQPRRAAGAPCFDDVQCAASKGFADCIAVEGAAACLDFVLAPQAAMSQPCGLQAAGSETPCGSGLWCDAPGSGIGTCVGPLGSGATCKTSDDVCALGLVCLGQDAGYSCAPTMVGRKVADSCGPSFPSVCDPFAQLECVAGACASYGDGTEGSHCSNHDLGELTCQRGLVCGATAVCIVPHKEGEACQRASECASRACGADHLCAARRCDSH